MKTSSLHTACRQLRNPFAFRADDDKHGSLAQEGLRADRRLSATCGRWMPCLGLSNLIKAISTKCLGLADVEAETIGKSYVPSGARRTARKGNPQGERGGAHQFYTPGEVGEIMARILDPEPGMEIYDPTCGSGGLLIKCEIAMEANMKDKKRTVAPLKLFGWDVVPEEDGKSEKFSLGSLGAGALKLN